jgi:hypothetical protein
MSKWCILLTTTVNVNQEIPNMVQKTNQERLETYLTTIHRWLSTDLPIVVVENSGYTFPELKDTRVEVITFDSMKSEPFMNFKNFFHLKEKGIYEINSIHHACFHSTQIQNATHLIKVTGRYFIPCLEGILKNLPYNTKAVRQFNSAQCEVVGCKKEYINTIFNYNVLNKNNKISDHIEEVYQYRISKIPHVILPIMPIPPTKRGGVDEIKTFL